MSSLADLAEIQIMKKFGVYVKFSNAEEHAQLGGYSDNDDNVVARTPAKNAMALEQLKLSVMEMVHPKVRLPCPVCRLPLDADLLPPLFPLLQDKDYTLETVSIPRRYHRTLLGEKSIFIHDIEGKTNSTVRFPNKETASDIVTIFGPESQVHIAAAMLLDHVPFEADLHVPFAPDIGQVVATHEYVQLVERLKRDLQIAIVAPTRFSQGDDSLFKFRCQRSNIDFLGSAKDALEEYLVSRKVGVYQSSAHGWSDSYSDAFSHFNSALLPSKLTVAESELEGQGESLVQRQPRTVASSQDVKALFDHGGYYPDGGPPSPLPTAGPSDVNGLPQPSLIAGSFPYGSAGGRGANGSSNGAAVAGGGGPFGQDRPATGALPASSSAASFGHRQRVSELWTPSHTMVRRGLLWILIAAAATWLTSLACSSSDLQHPPPPARQSYHQGQHPRGHGQHPSLSGSIPTPAAHSPSSPVRSTAAVDEALKRGSDPMLAAKLKEVGAARSASHRAQSLSLDMSSSSSFAHHRANYSTSNRAAAVPSTAQSPPASASSGQFPAQLREQTLYNSSGADDLPLSNLRLN